MPGQPDQSEEQQQLDLPGPYNAAQWAQENKERLQPPVGNALMYGEGEFKVMFVSGPNLRTDFHIEDHEEYFQQIRGDMTLRVRDEKAQCFRDIRIREGDMFVLPARVPHSPQRPEGTLGMVMEVQRREGDRDGLRWYCDECHKVVYEEWFFCTDLGTQLKPIIERYYESEDRRTCGECGHVNSIPQ